MSGRFPSPARRLLSREVVKAPRAAARRVKTRLSRYEHALRTARTPSAALRRSLRANAGLGSAVEAFRRRDEPRFFFGPGDAAATAEYLGRSEPGWRERTLADADRVCDHVVRLLGADSFDLDDYVSRHGPEVGSLPWHEDVLNEYRWNPRTFYTDVPVPYDQADVKVPWELSRFQHLTVVGMAYAASREPRYAREIVAQIDDWIGANPVGYGINWASTMDVAMRATGWLWAYHLVADAPEVTDEFVARLLASLLQHGRHVERNISVYEGGVTTNHTVADYAALVHLGVLLPELRDAARWTETGMEGLARCMRTHVTRDGVDYESSIAYHRLVVEMYLDSLLIAERNGLAFPPDYRVSLERMFEFVLHYTAPDGLAPLVGDSDDGRWHLLSRYSDWLPRDHRYLLAAGASLFGRSDFAGAARGAAGAAEEVAWLLGPAAAAAFIHGNEGPPELASRAFPDGGRYVMRHGSHHALVSTDEVGTGGFGNHKHNDILSFELIVDGEPVIVDCGSYQYLSDRPTREAFRATRSHNTLVVEGVEQNQVTDTFRMRRDARVDVHAWTSTDRLDVLDASHSGYERLPTPVRHRRRIQFRKDPFAWLVLDALEGQGRHGVESFLHLAPGGRVTEAATWRDRVQDALRELGVAEPPPERAWIYGARAGEILIAPLNWERTSVEEGWVSARYGQRVRGPVMRMSGTLASGEMAGYILLRGSTA